MERGYGLRTILEAEIRLNEQLIMTFSLVLF